MKIRNGALALFLFSLSTLHAETYRQWLSAKPADTPLALHFSSPPAMSKIQEFAYVQQGAKDKKGNDYYWRVPKIPPGNEAGWLTLEKKTGAPPAEPLKLTLYYTEVLPRDLRHPNEEISEKRAYWDKPLNLLDYNSDVRVARLTRSIVIPAASVDTFSLPVLLQTLRFQISFNGIQRLVAVQAELSDASGKILDRTLPVELYYAENTNNYRNSGVGWTTGDPESDRSMREFAGIANTLTMPSLPPIFESYLSVNALWLGAENTSQVPLAPELARKLLLSGMWIYGRDKAASQLRQLVGLPPSQECVGLGGIQSLKEASYQQKRNLNTPYPGSSSLGESYHAYDNNDPGTPQGFRLENKKNLFEPLKSAYLCFTFAAFGGFVLICAVGMPFAFIRLRGPQRVVLWWAVPLLSTVYGMLAWAGGQCLMSKTPQVQTVEYRIAYGDWAETYCQTVVHFLTLRSEDISWSGPPDTLRLHDSYYRNFDDVDFDEFFEQTPEGGKVGIRDVTGGFSGGMEFCYFAPLDKPVSLVLQDGKPALRARIPLTQVFFRDGGSWKTVRDIAGGSVIPFQKFSEGSNFIQNLPGRLEKMLEDVPDENSTTNRYLIACTTETPLLKTGLAEKNESASVIWILQLPAPAGEKGQTP